METKTEHYSGSDCTGISGDANRVLTISNTEKTEDDGFLVYVSGLALALTSEYTVTHNSSETTVTFINKLWDDQKIIVQYVQQIEGTGDQATSDDFIDGPLGDFGVTVTRTPVTVTTDFHGNKTYTDGTDEDIEIVFLNPSTKYILDKSGLNEVFDAKMFTKSTQTINKYDKITYDSKIYRVDTVSKRNFNGNTIFKSITLFFLEDE